ncbi:MAG: hypothetical protein LBV69_08880 [Bacteroidales bacterium]|jgi:hypothetical protein|nr:hypothetical protein [Bacteroidales bacterium]
MLIPKSKVSSSNGILSVEAIDNLTFSIPSKNLSTVKIASLGSIAYIKPILSKRYFVNLPVPQPIP